FLHITLRPLSAMLRFYHRALAQLAFDGVSRRAARVEKTTAGFDHTRGVRFSAPVVRRLAERMTQQQIFVADRVPFAVFLESQRSGPSLVEWRRGDAEHIDAAIGHAAFGMNGPMMQPDRRRRA